MKLLLPEEIENIFIEQFLFPKQPLFGAVATLRQQEPGLRMMRIYDFDAEGRPLLLTHVLSHKWKEFISHPYATLCFLNESRLTQIVLRGELQLDTPATAPEKAHHYWPLIRPDVKRIYDPKHLVGDPYSETEVLNIEQKAPDTLGIVSVIPSFWEVLSLAREYTESQRYQFHLIEGMWQKRRVHVG